MIFPASPPLLIKKVFGGLVWNIKTQDKKIYLTFDDGPIPEVTPFVLQTLKQFNAKATFFCIGDNVAKYSDLFRTIIKEGHQIGNHTQQHLDAWKTHHERYLANVEKAAETFRQNHKDFSRIHSKKLFRPPYGKITPGLTKNLRNKGYTIVMWDVLSYDWRQNCHPDSCLKTVLKHTEPGSIIVLHDSKKAYHNMSYVLPKLLEHYSNKGFTFECL